jgi:hypothetical protein
MHMRRKFPTDQATTAPYADSSGGGSAPTAAPPGPRRFPLLGRKVQGVCLAVGVTLIVPVSALSALALPPSAVKRLAGSVLTVPADIFRGDEAISELQAASDGGPLALGTAYLTSSRVGEALEAAANSGASEELADLLASGDAEAAPDDALRSELEAPDGTGSPEQPPASNDTGEQGGGGQSEEPGKGNGQGNGNGNGNGQGNGNGTGQGNGNGNGEPGNGNGDHGQGDGHGSEEGPGQGQGNDNDNGQGNGNGNGNENENGEGNGNGNGDHGQGDGHGSEEGPGQGQGNDNDNGQGNDNENENGEGNGNGNDEQGNGNGDHGQGDGNGSEEGPGQGQGNDNDNGPGNGNGQGQDAPFTAPEPDQDPSDQTGGSENESESAGNQGGQGQNGGGQNDSGQGKGPKS